MAVFGFPLLLHLVMVRRDFSIDIVLIHKVKLAFLTEKNLN